MEDFIEDENNTINTHLDTHHKAFFFEKAEDYSNEYEYRWIIKNNKHKCEYISIKNAMHAIIIGEFFPSKYKSKLLKYSKTNNIPVNKIVWHNGSPYISNGI